MFIKQDNLAKTINSSGIGLTVTVKNAARQVFLKQTHRYKSAEMQRGIGKMTNLQELTGHESGAVRYRDGDIYVLNWASVDGLPRSLGPLYPIGLGDDLSNYVEAEPPADVIKAMAAHDAEQTGSDPEHDYDRDQLHCYYLPDHDVHVVWHDNWN